MAAAAIAPHTSAPLPGPTEDRLEWFAENSRSLRRTLLLRRDGARLHAGSRPADTDLGRIAHKLSFLVSGGLPDGVAQMALLAAGRFTVGSVLEEQSDLEHDAPAAPHPHVMDHEAAFEAGLALITGGLARHQTDGAVELPDP